MSINASLAALTVPMSSLRPDARNVRTHDERSVEAIVRSLREFGQQKPIVALADGTVIAGNGTLEAARRLGWTSIAVVRFDDEAKARAYAIADNRTAELSAWDERALADALQELGADFPLDALGFAEHDVSRMLADDSAPVDPYEEWKQMPDYNQPDMMPVRRLIVNFRSAADVAAFAKLIGQELTDKTRSIWHPAAEREQHIDKRYLSTAGAPETEH